MVSQWVHVCFTCIIAMIWQKDLCGTSYISYLSSPVSLFMSVMTDFYPLVLFLGLNMNKVLVVAFRSTNLQYVNM